MEQENFRVFARVYRKDNIVSAEKIELNSSFYSLSSSVSDETFSKKNSTKSSLHDQNDNGNEVNCLESNHKDYSINLFKKDNKKKFDFKQIFSSTNNQEEYESVKDLIQSCVEGYSVTILSFGVSGAGKTFTLFGNEKQLGLVYFSLKDLFLHVEEEEKRKNNHLYIEMSYLELYNNHFHNLLRNVQKPKKNKINTPQKNSNNESFNEKLATPITTTTAKPVPTATSVDSDCEETMSKKTTSTSTPSSKLVSSSSSLNIKNCDDKNFLFKDSSNKVHNNSNSYINEKIEIHESVNFGVFLSGYESLKVSIEDFDEAIYYIDQGLYFLFFVFYLVGSF
jgi:hypothetical protein